MLLSVTHETKFRDQLSLLQPTGIIHDLLMCITHRANKKVLRQPANTGLPYSCRHQPS